MKTQNEQIKEHILKGLSIDPLTALSLFGCFRLSGRIYDLKKEGLPIESEMVKSGEKRFARYFIKSFEK